MYLFIGTPELILIGVVVLLLFGADKMPHFARGLGKVIRQAKDARAYISDEISKGVSEAEEVKKTVRKTEEEAAENVEETSKKERPTPERSVKR